jgi:hypothetical protein
MQIPVPSELVDEAEQLFAPPDHPVFQLVPPLFGKRIAHLYNTIGRPTVTSDSFWAIYRALLTSFGEVDQDYELMPT